MGPAARRVRLPLPAGRDTRHVRARRHRARVSRDVADPRGGLSAFFLALLAPIAPARRPRRRGGRPRRTRRARGARPIRRHSRVKDASWTRRQNASEPSPSPSPAANASATASSGTTSTRSVSITHSGVPAKSVSMLRSPGAGTRLRVASSVHSSDAVARVRPASTSAASASASGALSSKWNASRKRGVGSTDRVRANARQNVAQRSGTVMPMQVSCSMGASLRPGFAPRAVARGARKARRTLPAGPAGPVTCPRILGPRIPGKRLGLGSGDGFDAAG